MKYYIFFFIFFLSGLHPTYAQSEFSDPWDIGDYSSSFSFTHTENTAYYGNNFGRSTNEVYYRFTITSTMDIVITNCGSGLSDTYMYLLDECQSVITYNDDYPGEGACTNTAQSYIHETLAPGTYYIITEGYSSNGEITLNITATGGSTSTGDTFNNPIDIGTQNSNFSYADTQNTTNFTNNYGQTSNDVYYKFTLTKAMSVIISHCGSEVGDTYMHLLDASGTELAYNDDYYGDGQCSNPYNSYIKQSLAVGTYYVVSEGYGSNNGNITTTLQGIAPFSGLDATLSRNYIFTTTPTIESTDASLLTSDQSLQSIQYFDGLGRLEQTVQRAITPSGADLVSGITYDLYGRESQKWLPGAAAGNNGAYVTDYSSKSISTNGSDAKPYSTTEFEPSALNRVTGQSGPGVDWYTAGKKKMVEYTTNGSDVKLYSLDNGKLVYNAMYASASLYGQKTTDEDGHTVEEFTDKQGRKVLSRVYDPAAGNHDTYYVYDDLDNLIFVLPPMASDALGIGSWDDNNTAALKNYCYRYVYDKRKRCLGKRLPGCDWMYMTYDNADRLVATQDGIQFAKKQWTINRYDRFNRLLYSFLTTSTQTIITTTLKNSAVSEVYDGNAATGGYSLMGGASSPFVITALLTVNYYDNYAFLSLYNPSGMLTNTTQSGYTPPDATPSAPAYAKTMLTGTRTYHLDNPALFEVTALYYDKYGRVVQTRATNHLGGYDIAYNDIDFTGKPNKTLKTHGISGTTPSVTELYTYTYDKAQRLLTTTHSLNGGAMVTLVANSYDPLGRVQTKTLGGVDATTYGYNIRSWVTGITGSRFTENLYYNQNTANLPTFTACYNGNISGMQWNVPSEGLGYSRAYTFGYDALNRLTDGNYCGFNGSAVSGTSGRYNETFGYDKMGNITNFARWGLQYSSPTMIYDKIDELTFTHNGNQVTKVTDTGNSGIYNGDEEFQLNTVVTGNSCAYDANGNRLYDSNSNVWGIKYNIQNLPDVMQFYQGHQTLYTYSASGAKLKVVDKTAPAGVVLPVSSLNTILTNPSISSATATDYVGNYIYATDQYGTQSLLRILLPEGYWQGGTYYYYLKDHLGSNRVVINGGSTVVESNSYYPSGMRFGESVVSGGNVQPYRHTGHEIQGMHGLNWIDNGARFRIVDVPGFTGVDPLAEKYYSISPYAYCENNPINSVDPDGMSSENPYRLTSSYVTQDNILIYHKNDGDPNVYLVSDIGSWIMNGLKKDGLEIIGREYPNVNYDEQIGKNTSYFNYAENLGNSYYPKDPFLELNSDIESCFIPVFGWIKWLKLGKLGKSLIRFGKTENQIFHVFRHIDKMGLSRKIVTEAIEKDLKNLSSKLKIGETKSIIVEVEGKKLQYNVHKLPDGTINIGRIHEAK